MQNRIRHLSAIGALTRAIKTLPEVSHRAGQQAARREDAEALETIKALRERLRVASNLCTTIIVALEAERSLPAGVVTPGEGQGE